MKKIFLGLLTGISVVCALLLIIVGYSDRLNPVSFPMFSWIGMLLPVFIGINLVMLFLWILVKWRRAWIPVVALIVCYGPIRTYIPLHSNGTPPEGCIKVMTYNVSNYGGNKIYTKEQASDSITTLIQQEMPDIVCTQEGSNIVLDLMKNLYAYNDTFCIVSPSSKNVFNVIGMHTRFPILKRERIDFESIGNGSMAFFLLIDSDTVVVVNNHFESFHLSVNDRQGYRDVLKGNLERDSVSAETKHLIRKVIEADVKRASQADAVHEYIGKQLAAGRPVIVCGDFNDTPISYARRTVARGLKDCYVESGCGVGISFNQGGFFFRIDHILCSSQFTPYNCKVINTIDASDHYPVICWLKKE